VVAQLVQDLVHLERRRQRLYQHRRLFRHDD
jgi:RNA polymerase-interacting CarD/CdnL/TRCF family regulator